jgi:aquaporin Z
VDPSRWRATLARFHLSEWGAELAGTAILMLGGLSAVALDFGRGSPVAAAIPAVSPRLLLTGALFAATGSLVAISPLGRLSGAHVNPAVTVAFWLTRQVHPHDLAGYLAAQFGGALIGVGVWRLAWGSQAESVMGGVTAPGPGVLPWQAVAIEALMTAILVLTIFLFVSKPRLMRWTPLAVWLVVTVLVWQGALLTGTSLNPARSLGPAVIRGSYSSIWIYFLGPLLGAAVAAGLVHLLGARFRPLTAKLFHDPRYPTIFRAARPMAMSSGPA